MSLDVGFTVAFDFTGIPAIVLTPTSTIPMSDQPSLTGYFSITQPDGITTTGLYNSVAWNGIGFNTYSVPLRMSADQTYQKGIYTVIFYAKCGGYTNAQFLRSWDMEYLPVTQTFIDGFDCFTPKLTYQDSTNYGVGGYNITSSIFQWTCTIPAGKITGNGAIVDLSVNGNYYDSVYVLNYTKLTNYQHSAYAWLNVLDKQTKQITRQAVIPTTMVLMLAWLVNLQAARDAAAGCCQTYDALDEIFEDANGLYQLMRTRVCQRNTTGLISTFTQFYNLTHNYQPVLYVNSNGIIPVYDFTTGCGATGGGTQTALIPKPATYTAFNDGEITAKMPAMLGYTGIFYVTLGINPLRLTDISPLNPNTAEITLLNGITMQAGQTLIILFY